MQSAGGVGGDGQRFGDDLDPQTREDALDVLRDLLAWRTTAARWDGIATLVDSMEHAVHNQDWAALRKVTIDLELVSPTRTGTPGDKPKEPPPKPVRDQANRIVHSLGKAEPRR